MIDLGEKQIFFGGGGTQKNITSYYPSNMINFGEKSIFLDTLLGEGGGVKKILDAENMAQIQGVCKK